MMVPVPPDVRDAIEYYQESYSDDWSRPFLFSMRRTRLSVEKILTWDDYSAWGDLEPGELRGLRGRRLLEALVPFRGPEWARMAMVWLREGKIPPVVLVDGKQARCIGDGRGRVNLAVGLGLPSLDVIIVKEKG